MTGTSNIEAFSREVQDWAERVPPDMIVKEQRRLSFFAYDKIDEKMPVKSGHARFNLQIAVNDPTRGEIPGVDPSGAEARARAQAALADLPPYANVVIHDSVPYIEELEHGSSSQAPAGMFDITAHELVQGFDPHYDPEGLAGLGVL